MRVNILNDLQIFVNGKKNGKTFENTTNALYVHTWQKKLHENVDVTVCTYVARMCVCCAKYRCVYIFIYLDIYIDI